jgi:hypothetical protein
MTELSGRLADAGSTYLAFLWHAFQQDSGWFRNFMGFERHWLEEKGSEDSHARALWAAGTGVGRAHNEGHRKLCSVLFDRALPVMERFTSPRAWAYGLLAIHEYFRRFTGDREVNRMRKLLTEKLLGLWRKVHAPDWPWFENIVSYDNARLPHAADSQRVLDAESEGARSRVGSAALDHSIADRSRGDIFGRSDAMDFTSAAARSRNSINSRSRRAPMISACLEAFRATQDPFFSRAARWAFEWFLGRNDLGLPLYDSTTGGCRDALASGPRQREPGRRIEPFLPSRARGNAAEPDPHPVYQIAMSPVPVYRRELQFLPDSGRVLVRSFIPQNPQRIVQIIGRALAVSEQEAEREVAAVKRDFGARHHDVEAMLLRIFKRVEPQLFTDRPLTRTRQLFIGALFTGEYALESAALFNPSIVPHPDQSGLAPGSLRFILSLRATGEGHISSIEFRTGVIDGAGAITADPVTRFVTTPELRLNPTYNKQSFTVKLYEMGFENEHTAAVMRSLGPTFTLEQLDDSVCAISQRSHVVTREEQRTLECVRWLAESNYELSFSPKTAMCERILFPVSANESNGIEDARFVRFVDDDGSIAYYATYTAYNGRVILPQLLETARLSRLPRPDTQRARGRKQRHGALSAPHQWQLRDALTAGRRKPFPDVFGQPALLEQPPPARRPEPNLGTGEGR